MRVLKKFLVVVTGLLGAVVAVSTTQAETNTSQEQANIKLVADFYAALEQDYQHGNKKVRSIAEQYLSPDYIQHMEAAQSYGPGREGYIRMFEQMPAVPLPPGGVAPPSPKVLTIMAKGDLVFRLNSRPGGPTDKNPIYIFNVFRVQGGKLAEHWDGYSRQIEKAPGAAGVSSGGNHLTSTAP
jgi:predicted SnoaL-like aldol condensation-catalyzing enzyme